MVNLNEAGLLILITYFLPGFIITAILDGRLYLGKRNLATLVYKYLLFGIMNQTLAYFIDRLYYYVFKTFLIYNEIPIVVLRNVILPVMLGTVLAFFLSNELVYTEIESERVKSVILLINRLKKIGLKFFSFLGLNRDALIESSWDYIFFEIMNAGGSYIMVTLNDGTIIYGFFGINSFASDGTNGVKDIYIEQTYKNIEFTDEFNVGILLKENEIKHIEFPNN